MRKYKIWGIILLALAILATGGFLFRKQLAVLAFDMFLSDRVEKTLEQTYKPIIGKKEVIREENTPFSMLLLGIDQRDKEAGRSDSLIYSIMRPKENRILLLSIPRDAYAEIVGRDMQDKIAHAYAFGEAKMSVETVEKLLQHPVNHYAAINFTGFKDVVDALDGVKLPITKDIVNKHWSHDKFRIEANKPIYNGLEALNYVRYREDSDMNRTMRNRIFLQAIMERAVELDKVGRIPELMEIAGDNFTTDMLPKDMIDLAKAMFAKDSLPAFSTYMLDGEGAMMNGIWYYMLDEEDLQYARQLIENWLDPAVDSVSLMEPREKA